jgi:2-oxoglutarate ferredoxin oxidoreductase subunit alpha
VPEISELPDLKVEFRTDPTDFMPYMRDPNTLARPWVRPGTPGLEHRIGGIEKDARSGAVSYDPDNHEKMVKLRAAKIDGIAVPPLTVDGPEDAELLLIGWGSTYGSIRAAVERARAQGLSVAQAHLRYLNPLPANLTEVLKRYPKVLVPEMNMGQLATILRAKTLVDCQSLCKIKGKAFATSEILNTIEAHFYHEAVK